MLMELPKRRQEEAWASVNEHWQRFSVAFEYPVYFTEGVFRSSNPLLWQTMCRLEPAKRHRALVFVDDGLLVPRPDLLDEISAYAALNRTRLDFVADPIVVPGGERIKDGFHYFEGMQRSLLEHHIDRHSYVIAVGGGAVLDAVGLVAATTHRGVRHIRLPSTVLSQDDSGIGVKNGVNNHGQKNFVGTFAPPFAVLNDIEFVEVLERRDKIAGMAEAVKVALIRDRAFFNWIEGNVEALARFDRAALSYLIRRCAELHMHQIAHGGDPFESGSARPLDYGHWAAHKLEGLTNYDLRHGEAVAIGIALDTRYSVLSGLLADGEDGRICRLLERLGFAIWHEQLEALSGGGDHVILEGLRDFREHLGGELSVTLLREIGVGIEVHEMQESLVLQAISWLHRRQAS